MAIDNEVSGLTFQLTEHEEQSKVISWANELVAMGVIELAALYAITNQNILFSKISKTHRMQAINYMKAEGLKKGVPDLHLPVSRGGYNSLYIEMKAKNGKPSKEQEVWADRLSGYGNLVIYCWGAGEAIQVLSDYLAGVYVLT